MPNIKNPDTSKSKTDSSAHRSPETKRAEFRQYLEKTGVLDALTRVLVGLYEEPEKPVNPIEYFLDRLATGVPMKEELQNLHSELEELQERLKEVEEDNGRLRASLEKFEEFKLPDEVKAATHAIEVSGEKSEGEYEEM